MGDDRTTVRGDEVALARFADAATVIETAIALGMDMPALPGMTVWTAEIALEASDGRHPFLLGIFTSQEAALTAVRNWVLHEWDDAPFALPWEDDDDPDQAPEDFFARRQAWLSAATDAAVINAYFVGSEDTYSVLPAQIKPAPEPAA